MLDCDDSYTNNISDYLQQCGLELDLIHYSQFDISSQFQYVAIVLPPGPKAPKDIPILYNIIDKYKTKTNILGICLGHQAIGEYFGHKLSISYQPLHGVSTEIFHNQDAIFNSMNMPSFLAMRYNSLTIEDCSSSDLEVICRDKNQEIMGLKHRFLPIYSFQFHPESVGTPQGMNLFQNWTKFINI